MWLIAEACHPFDPLAPQPDWLDTILSDWGLIWQRWRVLHQHLCVSALKEIPFMLIAPAKNAMEKLYIIKLGKDICQP